ncbi:hypothetical protein BCR41DRAFT_424316 [Lobosporangium transversale]|uniref:Uncharacterized protein n=1 Tax=Lobosporangium transversale TaxID=64571 RepID=A0A1Y2GGV7_9FUNG|nr:hypothetical protein BCR41DRAFT_424316 [Lobosporangium transversale]ORZ09130.1 hypothetical protein BCR41DRAFT_424316 [Lobosporangium transversale]|eukprot:XP_021878757.1 hypothetical protein BCR41DRAFT_424316 [Lobosporangium transversale]
MPYLIFSCVKLIALIKGGTISHCSILKPSAFRAATLKNDVARVICHLIPYAGMGLNYSLYALAAPSPTRYFTSLQVGTVTRTQSASAGFNPEHHPIVLQQLVESLSPSEFVAPLSASSNAKEAMAKGSLSDKPPVATQGSHQGPVTDGHA